MQNYLRAWENKNSRGIKDKLRSEENDQFAEWRVRGEWFKPSWEILAHINYANYLKGQDFARAELLQLVSEHQHELPEWLNSWADKIDGERESKFMATFDYPAEELAE